MPNTFVLFVNIKPLGKLSSILQYNIDDSTSLNPISTVSNLNWYEFIYSSVLSSTELKSSSYTCCVFRLSLNNIYSSDEFVL